MDREQRAVVLVSGGVNSCVAASLKEPYEPALLHVRYPHRAAEREAECFDRIAEHLHVEHKLMADLDHLAHVGGNARVDRKLPIEDAATLTDHSANTYVPGLMPAMLSLAFQWAHVIKATKIVVGASENLGPPGPPTANLYPDCRREVFQVFDELMRLARPGLEPIALSLPLIQLTRPDVVRLGQRLEAPLESTWSCYASNETPCDQCYGCVTRTRGFIEAGQPDPALAGAKKR
jgi:7-cyano-7-deazaguanine synthase